MATEPSAADRDLSTQPLPVVGPQVRAVVTSEDEAPAIFRPSADADEPETTDAGDSETTDAGEAAGAPAAEPVAAVAEETAAEEGEGEGTADDGDAAADDPTTEPETAAAETDPVVADEPTPAAPDPARADAPDESAAPAAEDPEAPLPPLPPIPAAVAAATSAPIEAPDETAEATAPDALRLRGVTKAYGGADAVYGIDLTVPAGSFYGIVGPNGAGKTTTLSMISGLLKPGAGSIEVFGIDLLRRPRQAKALIGVLPDRVRTFDRLTGRQLLYYFGVLRGLKPAVVSTRTDDLARAFDIGDALGRVVADYSAGMRKKVMLAGALIHSPRLLVLDEPFEAVDPVSAASILEILSSYVAHGGTVVLSSHGMDLVESVCSRIAVIVSGHVLAEGTVDEVKGEITLEERFVELSASGGSTEGLEWLHRSSD
ncbi:ABC transporter ATP-binding protein [Microbacterium sediminis]|nr:ABC transporter ATP-binding protein [Microbacterium sediminis]